MIHLAAFSGSIPTTSTNLPLTAIQDQVIPKNTSGNFLMPWERRLEWVFGLGTGISRLRLNTPSLREVCLPSVQPVEAAATVPSKPGICYYYGLGPVLPKLDEFGIDTTTSDAGTQTHYAVVAFGDGNRNIFPGRSYRARATGTITATTGAWVNGSFTFDQTLPGGRYSIVGMDIIGANLLAARLVFPGGGPRPGVLARNSLANTPSPLFGFGVLGELGQFDSTAVPTIDILSVGANTAQELYLDLIKVG